MTATVRYLRLHLHLPDGGRRAVGYLSRLGDYLRVSFDDDYVADPMRPTLSLQYRGATEEATRAILRATQDERLVRADGRWPTWFANLLPEGHNRERLARERGCDVDDEFELLAAAGRDLMGAVEVEPVPVDAKLPGSVVAWHAAMGDGRAVPEAVQAPVEDAASLAGVVTKFSAIKDGRRYVVRRRGEAGSYILKLPSTRHPDLVDNELAGYRLARALDLDCAEATRVAARDAELPEHVEVPHVLAVKRFDRAEGGRRVHMEEMAQALGYPPKQKHGRGLESDFPRMLTLLDRLSSNPSGDVQEAVRRLVTFTLMGNVDAHLKNWALLYPDGRAPRLSPLYDPACVTAWFAEMGEQEYALNRKVDRTLSALDWAGLRALIDKAGVPRAPRLVAIAKQTVRRALEAWPAILEGAPANLRRSVTARLDGGVALAP